MARQIKVSVKAVKQGVDTLQVLSSNPALCNSSSWPEELASRHEGRETCRFTVSLSLLGFEAVNNSQE